VTGIELKKQIKDYLVNKLEIELIEIELVAESSREYATNDEMKSEDRYDTRAIEASYLAGAQLKRLEEIKLDLQMIKELEIVPSYAVEMGSLVRLQTNSMSQWYFLSPILGGDLVAIEHYKIMVLSIFSPVGSEAMGLIVGDPFDVETPKAVRSYEILEII
jgi:transcription elongation GreA/GreB family factor